MGKSRIFRFSVALALAGMVSSQIPVTGGMSAFAADTYNGTTTSSSGNFLNIGGLSNRNVIQGAVFALVAYGLYVTLRNPGGGAAAGTVAGSGADAAAPAASTTPTTTTTTPTSDPAVLAANRTIYDIADTTPDFQTLAKSIRAAGLRDTFSSPGAYTVFAPTEAAFAALPAGSVDSLSQPENQAKLKSLLGYHTIKGAYTINQLKAMPDGTRLLTIDDQVVTLTTTGGLKINGVSVVETDEQASNGYVHSIGSVLTAPITAPA